MVKLDGDNWDFDKIIEFIDNHKESIPLPKDSK